MNCRRPVINQKGYRYTRTCPAIPCPFETHGLSFKFSIITIWTLWTICIALQFLVAAKSQGNKLDGKNWQLWVALFSEVLLDFPPAVLALSIILGLYSDLGTGRRQSYILQDCTAPDVDVLLTCCGESIEIITNTATAAASQDYPTDRLRVYVLDDANDEQLRLATQKLDHSHQRQSKPYAPIVYLSRKLGEGIYSHFKSGNLRFGIRESRICAGQGKNAGIEDNQSLGFIAALDADMIPARDWLKRMVPHLLINDKLGLACPPQNYYNLLKTPSDALGSQTDFDIYFSVQESLNDRLGAAMCTGSGYVARRSAIDSIGGWPLADAGEDYMCSAMLSDQGWDIAFVSHPSKSPCMLPLNV